MKRKKINYLGFLSLLGLIGLLGIWTGNTGLCGFFGFLYYLRYFNVIPDELFLENLRKASTITWLAEMLALVPLMFLCHAMAEAEKALPMAFGLSFAVAIFVFTFALLGLEIKESRGAAACDS